MKLFYRYLILSLIMFTSLLISSCAIVASRRNVTIVSYNVHNLFDEIDDGTEYPDYDVGTGRWSEDQFRQKLSAIAEVAQLTATGGPDILVLQEVEGEHALSVLNDEYLRTSRYLYTAIAEESSSAVRVACLSRFPIVEIRNHSIELPDGNAMRYILELVIDIDGIDLYLFNNHWKSKSGGAQETEHLRLAASRLLQTRIADVLARQRSAEIVVAGDLNESADEYDRVGGAYPTAIRQPGVYTMGRDHEGLIVTFDKSQCADGRNILYSPWYEAHLPGSYVFKGDWQAIDHIMVSAGLLDEKGLTITSFDVVSDPLLLNEDGFPETRKYSDHLPIVVELTRTQKPFIPRVVEVKDQGG